MAEEVMLSKEIKETFEGKVIARLVSYNDKLGVDVRQFVETGKYTGWTKKGIRLDMEEVQSLMKFLEDACEMMESATT